MSRFNKFFYDYTILNLFYLNNNNKFKINQKPNIFNCNQPNFIIIHYY